MQTVAPSDEEFIYNSGVIIFQIDLERNITFINRDFSKINNYTKDEIISQKYALLIHPDMPKAVLSKMWETIKAGQNWNGVVKNIEKNGSCYWSQTEIEPIKDLQNNVTGYISVAKPASEKSIQESTKLYQKMIQTQA